MQSKLEYEFYNALFQFLYRSCISVQISLLITRFVFRLEILGACHVHRYLQLYSYSYFKIRSDLASKSHVNQSTHEALRKFSNSWHPSWWCSLKNVLFRCHEYSCHEHIRICMEADYSFFSLVMSATRQTNSSCVLTDIFYSRFTH